MDFHHMTQRKYISMSHHPQMQSPRWMKGKGLVGLEVFFFGWTTYFLGSQDRKETLSNPASASTHVRLNEEKIENVSV